MANTSIFAAFNRMWQHALNKFATLQSVDKLQANHTELCDSLADGTFVPRKANSTTNDGLGNIITDTYLTSDPDGYITYDRTELPAIAGGLIAFRITDGNSSMSTIIADVCGGSLKHENTSSVFYGFFDPGEGYGQYVPMRLKFNTSNLISGTYTITGQIWNGNSNTWVEDPNWGVYDGIIEYKYLSPKYPIGLPYLIGTWEFSVEYMMDENYIYQDIEFTDDNNNAYTYMRLDGYNLYYGTETEESLACSDGWESGKNKITFASKQYVSEEFYEWFTNYATKQQSF